MSDFYHWAKNEVKLACENTTDDYSVFCYKSALRAFRSLCDDDHSGCSIAFTQHILNELIDMHPLTSIEDTPDNWESVTGDTDCKLYQCKRMASLFKTEYSDGRCTYSDNTRCCCENISDHCRYYSGKSRKIIKKMFPITMPYIPKDHYVLWLTRLNQSQEKYLAPLT